MKDLNYYMNLHYVTEITDLSEEDGGGVMLCHPELGRLSVNAWGETYEEARDMLDGVKRDFFERCLAEELAIPEPKAEDLQDYSGKLLLRMPRSLHKAIAEAAAEEGQSINAFIVSALTGSIARSNAIKEICGEIRFVMDAWRQLPDASYCSSRAAASQETMPYQWTEAGEYISCS